MPWNRADLSVTTFCFRHWFMIGFRNVRTVLDDGVEAPQNNLILVIQAGHSGVQRQRLWGVLFSLLLRKILGNEASHVPRQKGICYCGSQWSRNSLKYLLFHYRVVHDEWACAMVLSGPLTLCWLALHWERERSEIRLKINTRKLKVLSLTGHRTLPSINGQILEDLVQFANLSRVAFDDDGTECAITRHVKSDLRCLVEILEMRISQKQHEVEVVPRKYPMCAFIWESHMGSSHHCYSKAWSLH